MRFASMLLLQIALLARPALSGPTGSISGVLLDGTSRQPVAYASILIRELRMGAMTSEGGTFRFDSIPAGRHVLRASSIAHQLDSIAVDVGAGATTMVTMAVTSRWPWRHKPIPLNLGSDLRAAPGQLTCELKPVRPAFKVGERPEFIATIRNNGPTPVVLVYSADGSVFGSRYPIVTLEEFGSGGGIDLPRFSLCGNLNGLGSSDFAVVGPGEAFDPFGNGWRAPLETHGTARTPGRYTAVFRYSTNEEDGRHWLGWTIRGGLAPDLARLFARVPPVTLEARAEFVIEE